MQRICTLFMRICHDILMVENYDWILECNIILLRPKPTARSKGTLNHDFVGYFFPNILSGDFRIVYNPKV